MRTCVACMTNRPKRELVRVVRKVDGELAIDRKGKVSGRGAYLCPQASCVEKALKMRKLERALEVTLSPEFVILLREIQSEEGHQA